MGISFLIYTLLIDVRSVRTQLWRKTRLSVKINQHYQHIRKEELQVNHKLVPIKVLRRKIRIFRELCTQNTLPMYQYFVFGIILKFENIKCIIQQPQNFHA